MSRIFPPAMLSLLMEIVACESVAIGGRDQMIIGRDILNLCCIKFDGKRQRFSFEDD